MGKKKDKERKKKKEKARRSQPVNDALTAADPPATSAGEAVAIAPSTTLSFSSTSTDQAGDEPSEEPRPPITLTIDIGGTGTKMITVDALGRPLTARDRELTPDPCTPEAMLALLKPMVARQPAFARVSVGFPGVVKRGVVHTAPNLGTAAWQGFDLGGALATLTERPTRVANDAELQGYGVISGEGVELVLTFGTGLGTALYTDGRLVPNLELGHHPLTEGMTYEQRVCDDELSRLGKKAWQRRVAEVLAQLEPIFNYDRLYVGGGNAKKIKFDLPPRVARFTNVEGMSGGVRLWDH